MATYDKTIATGLILRLVTTPSAGNVSDNYTPVNVKAYLVTTTGRVVANATKNGSITIDGTNYYFSTVIGTLNSNSSKLLGEANKNVPHNADGTKTLSASVSFGLNITYSGTYIGTVSHNASELLTTIPRASKPTATGSFVLDGSITITTNRASDSFTHTLRYEWGNLLGPIANDVTTNAMWTIPKVLAAAIPNGVSGTLRIYCDTYNAGTFIGTAYTDYTVTVPDTADFKPTITGCTLTETVEGLNAQFADFVQSKSKIAVSVTAIGAYSSTIRNYSIVINGATYNTNTFTTDVLIDKGNQNCVVTVTDSRGRSASGTYPYNVLEYITPTISTFTVERCDADGTLNDEGSNAKAIINVSISPVNNKNTKMFNLLYKKQTETQYTTITLSNTSYSLNAEQIVPNIDVDSEYDFKLEATDYFITTSKEIPLSSAFTLIDFNASGRGIAFGKVSGKDAMEINMDIYDKYDTKIRNGLAAYDSDDLIDPNTCMEELFLTNHQNGPGDTSNTYYYIRQVFYENKTITSNRTQIAYPYSTGAIHERHYIDGVWSSWTKYATTSAGHG